MGLKFCISLNAPLCTNKLPENLVIVVMVHGKWTQERVPKLLDRDRGQSIFEPIFKASSGKPDPSQKM